MKSIWKKAGIVCGHLVCISIIVFCLTNGENKIFARKNNEKQTVVQPSVDSLPTVAPTQTPTPVPTQTPTPMPTQTPTPVPTQTPTPMPTQTPTPVPTQTPTPVPTQAPTPTPNMSLAERNKVKAQVLTNIEELKYEELDNKKYSWWFRRKKDHVPSGSGQAFDISEYQGYYLNAEAEDKVIYMTIDCGYGSSNTPKLLDIFKKHNVKVMFFVTKFFIDANPEYVKRMVEEGHLVGNHSVTHADLTAISDQEIYDEIIGCEDAFFEVTGKQMDMYFRPPEGAYSKRTMQIIKDLGYTSVYWSIAYNDYEKDNQPGKEWVINHFETYHHSGAIPLMHNDSQSNLEAMDEVLTLLEEQGYRFGTLDELVQSSD